MKKILLTMVLAVFSLTALHAQRTPHAFGFHFGGSTMDLEYQFHFNKKNFLDVTAGVFDLGDGFAAQGIYNWNIQEWSDWTPNFATWKFWGGLGAGVGFIDTPHDNGLMLGPVGTMGFGFTVKDLPLTIGIDYRPMLAFVVGDNSGIASSGFKNLGVTMTYRF